MCGILFILEGVSVCSENEHLPLHDVTASARYSVANFLPGLRSRGPDSCNIHVVQLGTAGGPSATVAGSVLQLRGTEPVVSPLFHPQTQDFLLWNGEIFGGGIDVGPDDNDSRCLLKALAEAPEAGIPRLLSDINGPWAMVYWRSRSQTFYFGRDVMGRRSLLIHLPHSQDKRFIMTSVAPSYSEMACAGFSELIPGIFCLDLQSCIGGNVLLKRISWATPQTRSLAQFRRPELDQTSPKDVWGGLTLQEHLDSSVTAARTAMLDVLQALRTSMASRCRHTRRSQMTSCDVDASHDLNGNIVSTSLLSAKVLILFSGGVDSTLLAMLAHEVVPRDEPIDLVNICFGGGISADREASLDALKELRSVAPTRNWRLIGIDKSMDDVDAARPHLMQLLAPANTVMDLNIGAALWMATQADGMLLEPLRHNGLREGQPAATSAPRGTHGSSADQPKAEELNGEDAGQKNQGTYYRSEARVVLLGHGADELFAGYGRHRTRYRAAGLHGLAEELTLDFNRLWIRNLGRDDRLVADRGREARHPYLDEGVIAAALRHPLSALIDFGLPPGEGDKKVLRECLRELGLPRAASRVKRAIQFGSRLARAANVQQFGGTRQANKNKAGSVKLAVALQNALKLSQ